MVVILAASLHIPPFLKPTSLKSLHYPHNPRPKFLYCLSLDQPNHQQSKISNGSNSSSIEVEIEPLRVLFAAGGTGCQIYPAVAIADEIKITNPNSQILFLGSESGMETSAVPSAGYEFTSIPTMKLARPILSLQNAGLPFNLIKSMSKSWEIIKEFKPHIVVGTGGYVSFPVCLISALEGLKVVIHEQSSVPGTANYILSFLAELVFVAYNSSVDYFPIDKKKIVVTGNPVRLSLRKFVSKAVARSFFFPKLAKIVDSETKVLLVLGGSLGANSMNIAVLNMYRQMLTERENLHIIWETGVDSFDEMDSLVRNHPRLILSQFLHDMDFAYAAADLIVSRAGAMTCSELLATGKPAILIPSPNVEEGYQFSNASLMADLAGSRIITEDELDTSTLRAAVIDILDNGLLMSVMSERALQAAKPNAGAEIAECVRSLVNLAPANKLKAEG